VLLINLCPQILLVPNVERLTFVPGQLATLVINGLLDLLALRNHGLLHLLVLKPPSNLIFFDPLSADFELLFFPLFGQNRLVFAHSRLHANFLDKLEFRTAKIYALMSTRG
jgi:hypothetical protein